MNMKKILISFVLALSFIMACGQVDVTLAKTYNCDTLVWTGDIDALSATLSALMPELEKAKASNKYEEAGLLSALCGKLFEGVGLYEIASMLEQSAIDCFEKVSSKDFDYAYLQALTMIDFAKLQMGMGESSSIVMDKLYEGLAKCPSAESWINETKRNDKNAMALTYKKIQYMLYVICVSTGDINQLAANYSEAIKEYTEAENQIRENMGIEQYTIEYAYVLAQMGRCFSCISDYNNAIKYYREALSYVESGIGINTQIYADLLCGLAGIYYSLNDNSQAWLYSNQVLDILNDKQFGAHPIAASNYELMSLLYLNDNDFVSSAGAASTAYEVFKETCGENSYLAQSAKVLSKLPEILTSQKLDENIKLIRDFSNSFAGVLTSIGPITPLYADKLLSDIYLRQKNPDMVIDEVQAVKKLLDNPNYSAIMTPATARDFYLNFGRAYVMKADYKNAVISYSTVLKYMRNMVRDNFAFLDEEKRADYWSVLSNRINSIMQLNTLEGDKDNVGSLLYDAILLQKGLLLSATQNLNRLVQESDDEDLQQKVLQLRLMKNSSGQKPEEINQLNDVIMTMAKKYGDFLDFVDFGWQDVERELGVDDVAIEFVTSISKTGSTSYSAEVIRHGYNNVKHIHLFDVPATLKTDSKNLKDLILNNVWNNELLALLRPNDHVWFSPAGELCGIGIEYLTGLNGKRMDETFNMHRLTSTRELALGHANEIKNGNIFKSKNGSCTLYGGLNYNSPIEDVELIAQAFEYEHRGISKAKSKGDYTSVRWKYLPGTKVEVEHISDILGGIKANAVIYTGNDGIEETFKAMNGDNKLVHFATHGFFSQLTGDPMMNSGLVLSGANVISKFGDHKLEDGFLLASEIANVNLGRTKLVVLSACNSGLGYVSSEGVFGLQRAFKQAGAQSILMSLWEIDDEIAQVMMNLFYESLVKGNSPSQSLLHSQHEIRKMVFDRNGIKISGSDPNVWASFVLLD